MNLGPKVQQYSRSLFQWSQCQNDPYTVQADVLTMVRTVHSTAVEPVIQTNPEDILLGYPYHTSQQPASQAPDLSLG